MTIVFIVGIVLWILLSALLFILAMTSDRRLEKNFDKRIYHKVMSLANKEDYLVINSINLKEGNSTYSVDYFVIANKFCYAINQLNITGVLSGEVKEKVFYNHTLDGSINEINNIFNTNKNTALKLDSYINKKIVAECEFVIPVIVVPNSLSISPSIRAEYKNSYMFKLKNLKKGILSIEKNSDVKPISKSSIETIKEQILNLNQVELIRKEDNDDIKDN